MTWRPFVTLLVLLLCCVVPLLPTEAHTFEGTQLAKLSLDDLQQPHRSREASRTLKINETFEFYDIKGSSIAELEQQMRLHGTSWDDGKVYAAVTSWDIRYHYEIAEEAGNYSIDSVVTDVFVIYRLPRMAASSSLDSGPLSQQWETYLKHLKEHEYGHKEISLKAAAEINQSLAELGSFSSKGALKKEAKRLVAIALKRLKQLQVAYDEETRHGVQQGAVLAGL